MIDEVQKSNSSKLWHCDPILHFHLCDEFPPHYSDSQPFMCVRPQSIKWYMTYDPTMEMAIACDIYCECINTNSFSRTLHHIATY